MPMRPALMLTTSLPRGPADPAGRFVAEMALDLTARGLPLRLLAPHGRRPLPGVPHLAYPTPPGIFDGPGAPDNLRRRPLRAGLAGLAATAALTAALHRHHRPGETLIAHWLVPTGLAALTRRAPLHLIAHGSDIALLEALPLGRPLARRLAAADAITFVSDDLRDRYAALIHPHPGPRRQYTLPMGITPLAPDPAQATRLRALARGRPIIATVGRLVPLKGLDTLTDALADRDDLIWLAAGDGPDGPALTARARARRAPLHLLGNLAPPARDALLSTATLYIHPSRPIGTRREGTPVSLLEALAAGVPTIATTLPGLIAAARPARAHLIPPDDPRALRHAIDHLLARPTLDDLRAAHRAHATRWQWSTLGAHHLDAITDR